MRTGLLGGATAKWPIEITQENGTKVQPGQYPEHVPRESWYLQTRLGLKNIVLSLKSQLWEDIQHGSIGGKV